MGQHIHAQLQLLLLHAGVCRVRLQGLQNGRKLIAQKHGDHSRRRLVGTQAMIVSGGGHSSPQKALVVVHSLHNGHQKQQELRVFIGRLPRREKVDAGIGGQGPVIMLTAAVDPGKGLFLEQAHQAMPRRHFLHNLHSQLVLVGSDVGGGENRCQLVLGGSHLVVLRFSQNAQLPKLLIQVGHVGLYPGLDRAEIVVVQLLALGGLGPEQGPAGVNEIAALIVYFLINKEILLLCAHRG